LQDRAIWQDGPQQATDPEVMAPVNKPFEIIGGLKVLSGNLGRAIMKVSALAEGGKTLVEAPAMVFNSQHELEAAFKDDKLNRDLVAVVRFQGPQAIGDIKIDTLGC
jgi:phosphogluconate dehydratase